MSAVVTDGDEVAVAMLSALVGVALTARPSPPNVVGPCAVWGNAPDGEGYGRRPGKGSSTLAHRVTYEATVGAIPAGLELDHLCRVRLCVNPRRVEAVTHAENMRRAAGHRVDERTECRNGHPFTPENTTLVKRDRKNGMPPYHERRCRTCMSETQRRSQAKRATRRAEP